MFNIPEGAQDFTYTEAESDEPGTIETDIELGDYSLDDSYIVDESDENVDYPDTLETPTILGVVNQILNTTATGSQSIDVIIEVEDIPGADTYDVRVIAI